MPSSQIIAFLVVVIDMALCGFISNSFITAVMVAEWAKCRTLDAKEQLLLSMGTSSICATVLMIPAITTYYLKLEFNHITMRMIHVFVSCVIFFRYWLLAWFCVFYCIKIVNGTHSLFLWCKLRISHLVPWLLAVSLAASLLFSVYAFHNISVQHQSTTTANVTNMTQGHSWLETGSSLQLFFLITGSSCPLLVTLLCSIMVVASLCRHIYNMTGKGASFRSRQTEAHIKAAGTVLSFLIIYVAFYMAHLLIVFRYFEKSEQRFGSIMCSVVQVMCPSAHGILLVFVNPKLKQAATQILSGAKP
ncbi:taste receptor type 2 member 40-like [Podarcis muralis]